MIYQNVNDFYFFFRNIDTHISFFIIIYYSISYFYIISDGNWRFSTFLIQILLICHILYVLFTQCQLVWIFCFAEVNQGWFQVPFAHVENPESTVWPVCYHIYKTLFIEEFFKNKLLNRHPRQLKMLSINDFKIYW